jgi:hypothetical protein
MPLLNTVDRKFATLPSASLAGNERSGARSHYIVMDPLARTVLERTLPYEARQACITDAKSRRLYEEKRTSCDSRLLTNTTRESNKYGSEAEDHGSASGADSLGQTSIDLREIGTTRPMSCMMAFSLPASDGRQ